MGSVRITSRQALEALLPVLEEDVSAVEREEEARSERAGIYAVVEEAEREWASADRVETVRVSRVFTDGRRARRAHRRAARVTLRSLPVRLDVADLDEGEAA